MQINQLEAKVRRRVGSKLQYEPRLNTHTHEIDYRYNAIENPNYLSATSETRRYFSTKKVGNCKYAYGWCRCCPRVTRKHQYKDKNYKYDMP